MSTETCVDCRAKDKKMQILRVDVEFELKKMREDLAEEKVFMEQQYQR